MKFVSRRTFIIISLLLPTLLACGTWNRYQEFNRQREVLATGSAAIDQGSHVAVKAYDRLQTLPSYRLTHQTVIRDHSGHRTHQLAVSDYDAAGNIHIIIQTFDNQKIEIYFIEGHAYQFEPEDNGWVDKGLGNPTEIYPPAGNLLLNFQAAENPMQLLSQLGVVPTEVGREQIGDRTAKRYELEHLVAEMAEAFGQSSRQALDLRGRLWIDSRSGVLLKSEIFLYEDQTGPPRQEFLLDVSEIGNIAPVTLPDPMLHHPEGIASATATAQTWTVLKVEMNYQGDLMSFEMIPLRVQVKANQTEMSLTMRQLPEHLFTEADTEPFLAQLRHHLTLSIPEHNLVAESNGFQIERSDSENQTLEVIYFFDVALENLNHVELIMSGYGNPLFAPVPVE